MSSINNGKNAANLPNLPVGVEATAQTAQTGAAAKPNSTENVLAIEQSNITALATMGLIPAGNGRVGRTDAGNKYALAATLTSQPPPLPNDRAPITAQTQTLFASMHTDINSAINQVRQTSSQQSQIVGAASGNSSEPATTTPSSALNALSNLTGTDASTAQGQTTINTAVNQVLSSNALDINTLSGSGMMAAFMTLQVKNDASGKELESTILDLTADARKTDIDGQISQNRVAMAKVAAAHEKQKKMGFLAPLIDAIMAIAAVLFSVITAGSGAALATMAVAAAVGFVAGGAVGGAKKGNGFDIGSAFMGMGIGASVGGAAAKLIMMALAKALSYAAEAVGSRALAEVGEKGVANAAKLSTRNLSNKASLAVNAGSMGVQAGGTIAKSYMQYDYEKTLADAKEAQGKAKLLKAMADALQDQYQAVSTSISGIIDRRQAAVNQMMSMLKAHQAVSQKTVSQISS